MDKVRLAFRIELRNTKQLAVIKSRKMFLQMFEDLKKLFKEEYHLVVEQYNKIRYQMWKLENKLQKTEEQNEYLEFINSEKDTFYDVNAIRFIDLAEGFQYSDPSDIDISPDEVAEANILYNQCFEFYGGYAQISANAKDQIGESAIIGQFLHKIKMQKEEIDQKN